METEQNWCTNNGAHNLLSLIADLKPLCFCVCHLFSDEIKWIFHFALFCSRHRRQPTTNNKQANERIIFVGCSPDSNFSIYIFHLNDWMENSALSYSSKNVCGCLCCVFNGVLLLSSVISFVVVVALFCGDKNGWQLINGCFWLEKIVSMLELKRETEKEQEKKKDANDFDAEELNQRIWQLSSILNLYLYQFSESYENLFVFRLIFRLVAWLRRISTSNYTWKIMIHLQWAEYDGREKYLVVVVVVLYLDMFNWATCLHSFSFSLALVNR